MKKLIATRDMTYATRRLRAGDEFEARPAHAKVLIALKKAKASDVREPGKIAAPPQSLVQKVKGADPFDHDGDGKPGGSNAPERTDDLADLRARYTQTFGKRPFMGWDAETLLDKLTAAE